MGGLRTRATGLLAALAVLGIAGTANATSISFVWVTAGGTSLGTSITFATTSSTAILDVRVDADAAGVTLASISIGYDPSVLQATAFTICPASPPGTGNQFGPGSCGDISNGFGTLLAPIGSPTIDNVNGIVNSLAASTLTSPGQTDILFSLATITFHAVGGQGSTPLTPVFRPGVDGITDGSFTFSLPPAFGASATHPVVPEPGTIGLVALGLAALALAGRRR